MKTIKQLREASMAIPKYRALGGNLYTGKELINYYSEYEADYKGVNTREAKAFMKASAKFTKDITATDKLKAQVKQIGAKMLRANNQLEADADNLYRLAQDAFEAEKKAGRAR